MRSMAQTVHLQVFVPGIQYHRLSGPAGQEPCVRTVIGADLQDPGIPLDLRPLKQVLP